MAFSAIRVEKGIIYYKIVDKFQPNGEKKHEKHNTIKYLRARNESQIEQSDTGSRHQSLRAFVF